MISLISVIRKIHFGQVLTTFFLGMTLFFSTGFVQMQAIASPILALATYQIDDADTVRTNKTLPSQYIDENLAANAQKNLKKNTDELKDKLNFNNQTPVENKAQDFVNNAKERAEQAGKTAQRSFENFTKTYR